MKKILILTIVLVMTLPFVSCGGSKGAKLAEKSYELTIKMLDGDADAADELLKLQEEALSLSDKEVEAYYKRLSELDE